jgi:hypothetical protein
MSFDQREKLSEIKRNLNSLKSNAMASGSEVTEKQMVTEESVEASNTKKKSVNPYILMLDQDFTVRDKRKQSLLGEEVKQEVVRKKEKIQKEIEEVLVDVSLSKSKTLRADKDYKLIYE